MENTPIKERFIKTGIFIISVMMLMALFGIENAFSFTNPVHDEHLGSSSDTTEVPNPSMEQAIVVNKVNAIIVDNDNVKWFNTDIGIVTFDGRDWKKYDAANALPKQSVKDLTYVENEEGSELWLATPAGAAITKLPIDEHANITTLNTENTKILSENVLRIAAGKNSIRWIGTDLGVSAVRGETWLTPDYKEHYTERMFKKYPITSMATNLTGDSVFVGTEGAGIARIYRDEVDAISGASVYAEWGPIILPSDYILCIYIAPDGTKWFGTEEGLAKHTGNDTLIGWTVFTMEEGLTDDFIQAICGDANGHIWIGTEVGISVFDGASWQTYTTDDGLSNNDIRSLATDKEGTVWIGTRTGISSFKNGQFINY